MLYLVSFTVKLYVRPLHYHFTACHVSIGEIVQYVYNLSASPAQTHTLYQLLLLRAAFFSFLVECGSFPRRLCVHFQKQLS